MLAVVCEARTRDASSFGRLTQYMHFGSGRSRKLDPATGEVVERGEMYYSDAIIDARTAVAEMEAVAAQNSRIVDPIFHYVLAWQEGEEPSADQWREAVRRTQAAMGMDAHQYIAALHRDGTTWHVHVLANRVDPDTYRAADLWKCYERLDVAIREIEHLQGWKESAGLARWQDGQAVLLTKDEKRSRREGRVETEAADQGPPAQMQSWRDAESFLSWVRSEPSRALDAMMKRPGVSWIHVHETLARFGLTLNRTQRQGLAGYTVSARDERGREVYARARGRSRREADDEGEGISDGTGQRSEPGGPRAFRPSGPDAQQLTWVVDRKRGFVEYSLAGRRAFTDEGSLLRMSKELKGTIDRDPLRVALQLAVQKWGRELSLSGDEAFRRAVVEEAARLGLQVRFKDAEDERYRQQCAARRGGAQPSGAKADPLAAYKRAVDEADQSGDSLKTALAVARLKVAEEYQAAGKNPMHQFSEIDVEARRRLFDGGAGQPSAKPAPAGDNKKDELAERQAREYAQDFRALADGRRVRTPGFADGGQLWSRVPEGIRKDIEQINAMPAAEREAAFESLQREAVGRTAQIRELLSASHCEIWWADREEGDSPLHWIKWSSRALTRGHAFLDVFQQPRVGTVHVLLCLRDHDVVDRAQNGIAIRCDD